MNKVILLGNLARDPEIRYTQSAEPLCVARYTVAVSKRFKRDGEPDADFVTCKSFGKQAEFVERYFKKGMRIALEGRISVYSYEDNTGQRKWVTEVVAENVEFAESKASSEAKRGQGGYDSGDPFSGAPMPPTPGNQSSYEPEGFSAITQSIDDDDLPF